MTINNSVDVSINIADSYQVQSNLKEVLILDEFAHDSSDKLNAGKYFTSNGLLAGTAIRVKRYTSLPSLAIDFKVTSIVYEKASIALSQKGVRAILVGRKDPTDTTITDGLVAIRAENDNWFGLLSTYGAKAVASEADNIDDIKEIDTWALANGKKFCTQTKDPDSLTTAITDIFSVLKARSSNATLAIFNNEYDTVNSKFTTHVDAGILPLILGYRAGLTTTLDKTLTGVTVSSGISDEGFANLTAKRANVYISERGVGVFKGNTLPSGRFFDTELYCIFLKEEIINNLRSLKINKSNAGSKVSYTNRGVGEAKAVLTTIFERELELGALTSFYKYINGNKLVQFNYIIAPLAVEQIPQAEVTERKYNYLNFEVRYSSEIGDIKVNGLMVV